MVDINPEAEHDGVKTVERQPYEKPEKKNGGDDIDSDSNVNTKYNEAGGKAKTLLSRVVNTVIVLMLIVNSKSC